MEPRTKGWLADTLVGGLVGGITGAIVAVNFVIFSGIEGGYEATIAEVFRQNLVAGIATVTILSAGPVLGVIGARRLRRNRARSNPE